jgi:ribosomal protein S18 acetylase RimI-like enzyme
MKTYEIKEITDDKVPDIIKLANHVFGFGTSTLISKKNMWGFYVADGTSVVGVIILVRGGKGEAFVQWIFVDPIAQGHKLASKLMEAGTKAMHEEGRTKQFALVRDDNSASWNLFLKAGYKVLPISQTLFKYSFHALLKRLEYGMVGGYSTWVKDETSKQKSIYPKYPLLRMTLTIAFLGASLTLFGLRGIEFLWTVIATVLSISWIRVIVAYPIARLYGKVKFIAPRGGFVLSFLLGIFTQAWWPIFGMFAPKEDLWSSTSYQKNLGIQSIMTWMSMNIMFILASFIFPDLFINGMNFILTYILVVNMIPFIPFDGLDGGKVYRYRPFLYGLSVIISIVTMIVFY